jgi:hypothetical protein
VVVVSGDLVGWDPFPGTHDVVVNDADGNQQYEVREVLIPIPDNHFPVFVAVSVVSI